MKKFLIFLLCAALAVMAVIGVNYHLKNGNIDISETKLIKYLQAGGGPVSGSRLSEWSGKEGVTYPNSSVVIYSKDIPQTEEGAWLLTKNENHLAGVRGVFLFDEEIFGSLSYQATWGKDTLNDDYHVKCEIGVSNLSILIFYDCKKKNSFDLCAMLDEIYPYIVGDEELQ